MSKAKLIDSSFTVWCNNLWNNSPSMWGHEGYHQHGGVDKATFIKTVESYGWKYIKGNWNCPSCAKEATK